MRSKSASGRGRGAEEGRQAAFPRHAARDADRDLILRLPGGVFIARSG